MIFKHFDTRYKFRIALWQITKKSWNFVYILAKQIFRQFDEIFAEILTKISKC